MDDNLKAFEEDISKLQEKIENDYLKTVTVMFTDLKGSTEYFEKHGDIKGRILIETHNKLLFPIIERHFGKIIKTIGDSIMATFTSEYLSVRAAIKMQKVLDKYNKTAEDKIRIRIGIHTGNAIVEEKDVFGDAVNVAARIESDTPPLRITISKAVLSGLKNHPEIKIRHLGKVKFKGKSEETETYSVLWRTTELKDDLPEKAEYVGNFDILKTKSKLVKKLDRRIIYIFSVLFFLLFLILYVFIKSEESKVKNLSEDRKKVVEYAKEFIGKKIPKSKHWPSSLSGFVKMVYLHFGVDITDVALKNKDGTWRTTSQLIYNFVKDNGKIFKKELPLPGDFVFFNNTYDRNKNGKTDDFITTVGLVIKTDDEETVYFLYKVGNTIRIKNMNLKYYDRKSVKSDNLIKIYNSPLRKSILADKRAKVSFLSSKLFNSYGTILDLKKDGITTSLKTFVKLKYLNKDKRKEVVKYALSFKDKNMPESSLWGNSSAGFVKMIFWKFKINLSKPEKLKNKRGRWFSLTGLIYNFSKENGRIYKNHNNVEIGDFIFFNNTYDKNKDGKLNDKFTSVGLIVKRSEDGNIDFLINISGKIVLKKLNLKNKNKEYNSVLRVFKGKKLCSDRLFFAFGSIFK